MGPLGAIATKSLAVLILFLVGGISFMQDEYFVYADSPLEVNVAATDFNHINPLIRDQEMKYDKKTRQQNTATVELNFPENIARKLDGSHGIVLIIQNMRNISRVNKSLDITNKHIFIRKNSNGYRWSGKNGDNNIVPLTLREHSGISNYNPFSIRGGQLDPWAIILQNKVSTFVPSINKQDLALVIVYICTQLAITIPVILLPMIADDPGASNTHLVSRAVFVGAIVSLSTLGASIGKFVNGFVCKGIGARTAGCIYLLGLTIFSLLLSTTKSFHGLAIAGMEFCASIMWTSCNVILANRYERDPKKLSSAIGALSLGSTGGVLLAKMLGTILLCNYHWRQVARFSGMMALLGSMIMFCFVKDVAREKRRTILGTYGGYQDNQSGLNGIFNSAFRVLSNRVFWMVGFAHTTAFLARSSDKLLGSFVREVAGLPIHLCGSLTSSVTIGFVLGLISGRKIDLLESPRERRLFTSRRYHRATLSAIGLALCANQNIGTFIGSTAHIIAITLLSGMMAYSVAFQYYLFPPAFAKIYDDDKAVCISFMDGMACLVATPIWSMVSMLVASSRVGSHGWSVAWLVIASFFGIGGNVMMRTLSSVIPSVGKES